MVEGLSEPSDDVLLAAYAGGDQDAFRQLLARYQRPLYAWLVSTTGSRDEADDLFQEIWLRVIRHVATFKGGSFRAWLWQIAHNLVIDTHRRRRPMVSLDATCDEGGDSLIDSLVASDPSPEQGVLREEMENAIWRAVAALPDHQRQVFLMRTQGGLVFSEIAVILGIPLTTALGKMHDAVVKLRTILKKEFER